MTDVDVDTPLPGTLNGSRASHAAASHDALPVRPEAGGPPSEAASSDNASSDNASSEALPPRAPAGVPADEPTAPLPEAARRDRVVIQLYQRGLLTPEQVHDALRRWERRNDAVMLWRVVGRLPSVDPDVVYAEAARIYAFPEARLTPESVDRALARQVIETVPPDQRERLLDLQLLPLRYEMDAERGIRKLILATPDPSHPDLYPFAQAADLGRFEVHYAPSAVIDPLLDELFPRRNEYLERVEAHSEAEALDLGTSYQPAHSDLVDEEQLEAEINRSALINLFEAALVEGVRMEASDIHIFPNAEQHTEIHMRVDGALRHWHTQDTVHPEAMLAVVKDRSMNIDRFDRDAAQDGYIQRQVDGKLVRYRVSVLPLASATREMKAESIVIRILDDRRIFTDLKQLNLQPTALERFQKAIRQPHGMVIMTGPTGSGKSTTLAAALHQVISPTRNVLTVEDPVEYVIEGARQIKLSHRLKLEQALRSILRHDPDVVMVGEMRDRPTAELAVKLANTGHLTFSTLHTNDAPSAISRLYKMGVEPFLLAHAINLVVAQRLMRTLCPDCKQVDPDPDPVMLHELGFSDAELNRHTFYRAARGSSCSTCGGAGYKGRQAIAEAMYFSRDLRRLIVQAGEVIDEEAMRRMAIDEGMQTLLGSARKVVLQGTSTIDELIRVVAT